MSGENAAVRALRRLLAGQRLAVLATQAPNHPYTSLVAFTAAEDLKRLYFVTTRATRKYHFLQAHPDVSLLIDSRSDADLDFHQAVAATAIGTAREVSGAERAAALALVVARHPHLVEFASAPSSALLEVTVDCWYVVSGFQNVTEIHLT